MKIFLTGSEGFVASHLLRKLREKNHEIFTCDIRTKGNPCDITNFADVMREMKGDIVIHLAALCSAGYSVKVPLQYIQTNVLGTANILEAMRLKRIPRIIIFSSGGVKGYEEGAPYLWTKRMDELLVEMYSKLYGIEGIILRPMNIYGERNHKGIVHLFIKAKKEKRTLEIHGDGSQARDFINVEDIVDAVMKAIELEKVPNGCFCAELGTGKETTILELAKIIKANYTLAREKMGKSGLKRSIADTSNAEHYLKWKAKTSLKKGIERLISTYL